MTQHPAPLSSPRGFLARLRRDRGGNTLVIMAMAMIPISGLAGSAIDMGRLYVVKSRLQQACDAGVLAGRKFMDPDSKTLDPAATAQAQNFFKNNFTSGWLDTAAPTFVPTKTADQQVAGTASVTVPMTIMKMFNAADVTINVACKARYDISDTDIVFVLDTTGSMACRPEDTDAQCNSYVSANPATTYTRPSSDPDATAGYLGSQAYAVPETSSGNGSRIKALRQAVKDFYATMAANVDANTRVRYGFVTYTSTVNAGKAIYQMSPSYLIGATGGETASYESRKVTGEYEVSRSSTDLSGFSSSDACLAASPNTRSPAGTSAQPYPFRTSDGQATLTVNEWVNASGKNPAKCTRVVKTMGPVYTWKQYDWDVSQFLLGGAVSDPTKVKGETSRWDGCIEERQTEAATTSFTSASYDLDPVLKPSSDIRTRWTPAWPDITYARYNYASTATVSTNGEYSSWPSLYSDARRRSGYYSCGKPIHRISEMTAAQVAAYVDAPDFRPLGGTYHDTGMIWGTRLLAMDGIFASDNVGRAGQPAPRKVIVFLTDGAMAPNQSIYGLYGTEYYDRRVSGGNFGQLTSYHNARFLYECQQANNRLKVDVWTVAIGLDSTPELTQCASNDSQALATTSGSGLSDLFKKIAKQVAMLRVEK